MFRASYITEDIEIHFSTEGEKTDYGVPSSPVWWEPNLDKVQIDSITIFGEELPVQNLPPKLRNAILSLDKEFTR